MIAMSDAARAGTRALVLTCTLGCAPNGTIYNQPPDAADELAPIPADDAACIPSNIMEAGPCCEEVYCYTPDDGGACEPAPSFQPPAPCTCGPKRGPYDGVTHGEKCCYLAWTQGCQ